MAKPIYIVGIGLGNPQTLTQEALEIIQRSDCLIGAKRMLDGFAHIAGARYFSCLPTEIATYIEEHPEHEQTVVLMSGDVGFYSGTKKLIDALGEERVELISGISSLVYFCGKLKTSWDDVHVVSVHGRDNAIIGPVMNHRKTFFLTGNNFTAQQVCIQLAQYGLGDVQVAIGEHLSYDNQRIIRGTAEQLIAEEYASLSVMLVTNEGFTQRSQITPGIDDEEFLRGKAPMTKCEVRNVSLGKMQLQPHHIAYDIGAGTGSVSIELALQLTDGMVYAIEQKEEALQLIEENKKKFQVHNLQTIHGKAPQGLEQLPSPDGVFIGGSSGNMKEILAVVLAKNPKARIVINAITLETVAEAIQCFKEFELVDVDIVQLSIAKSKEVGPYNMMMGQNPVYIMSGRGASGDE